jgi:hypothetical protein
MSRVENQQNNDSLEERQAREEAEITDRRITTTARTRRADEELTV